MCLGFSSEGEIVRPAPLVTMLFVGSQKQQVSSGAAQVNVLNGAESGGPTKESQSVSDLRGQTPMTPRYSERLAAPREVTCQAQEQQRDQGLGDPVPGGVSDPPPQP